MKRAIRTHRLNFAAIVGLLVLAIATVTYILSHQGVRFPFIQAAPFTINAELSTAQAVTPGQGESVRVSGVQIGRIGGVSLHNGRAVVHMGIEQSYKHLIHTDATALLRPRTGLDDMFIELNPGTATAPLAKPGYTIDVSNTLPDINPDEILASLDADTRGYLNLLVNGAGQGLSGRGGVELAQVLERFLPTHRDLAAINRSIATRGVDLRQAVNALQRLNTALGGEQSQIVQLVGSSSQVFRAFASQNHSITRAVADLPGTFQQTTTTLNDVQAFADQLGPATRELLPAAQALPAANRALTALAIPSAPILRTQIRPFVEATRPLIRDLRPAATNLAAATPHLSQTFGVLTHLFNMLGYNPGGGQHGYLWWLAWGQHISRTLFSNQNADGDFRPVMLEAGCTNLRKIAATNGGATGPATGFSTIISNFCPGGS